MKIHPEHQWNDRPELCLKVRSVRRSKHPQSASKQSIGLSCIGKQSPFSLWHKKKHVNTECGQDGQLLLVKLLAPELLFLILAHPVYKM